MNVSIWGQTSDLIITGDLILWTVFLATCIGRSLSHSPRVTVSYRFDCRWRLTKIINRWYIISTWGSNRIGGKEVLRYDDRGMIIMCCTAGYLVKIAPPGFSVTTPTFSEHEMQRYLKYCSKWRVSTIANLVTPLTYSYFPNLWET